MSENTTYIIVK